MYTGIRANIVQDIEMIVQSGHAFDEVGTVSLVQRRAHARTISCCYLCEALNKKQDGETQKLPPCTSHPPPCTSKPPTVYVETSIVDVETSIVYVETATVHAD